MTLIQEEKQKAKEILSGLGIATSLDFEREPTGTIFADIHDSLPESYFAGVTQYLTLRGIEITIDFIETAQNSGIVQSALAALSYGYKVSDKLSDENKKAIKLRGVKLY